MAEARGPSEIDGSREATRINRTLKSWCWEYIPRVALTAADDLTASRSRAPLKENKSRKRVRGRESSRAQRTLTVVRGLLSEGSAVAESASA